MNQRSRHPPTTSRVLVRRLELALGGGALTLSTAAALAIDGSLGLVALVLSGVAYGLTLGRVER